MMVLSADASITSENLGPDSNIFRSTGFLSRPLVLICEGEDEGSVKTISPVSISYVFGCCVGAIKAEKRLDKVTPITVEECCCCCC